jgi:pyridoxine 5-phosphate synthase
MLELGVNIDHVATLREARYRGKNSGEPDLVGAAKICEKAGASGITIHLREDRRHIQDRDIWALKEVVSSKLNLEMANAEEIVQIALKLKPEIVCIVPEKRAELTTEGGLDAQAHEPALKETAKRMAAHGILVSLFIDPIPRQVEAAARIGAQFIELHTGGFAQKFKDPEQRKVELKLLTEASRLAGALGIKVNAGHGLNYQNVPALKEVPNLVELNIGHSIVSRAVMVGLQSAVQEMIEVMKGYETR